MSIRSMGALVLAALAVAFAGVEVGQHLHPWRVGLAGTLAMGALLLAGALMQPSGRLIRLVATVVAMAAIGIPFGLTNRAVQYDERGRHRMSCLDAAHALGLGVQTYCLDHDDHLPPANDWRTASEWPLDPSVRCPEASAPWTYALSRAVAGIDVHSVSDPASVAEIFEADAYRPNASGGRTWFAPRHGGQGTVVTVDGRARLERPAEAKWKP